MYFGFKKWLNIAESVEENFDDWLDAVKTYAKPNESEIKSFNPTEQQKQLIIQVLKEKRKENQDYLKFLLGVLKSKPQAMKEDLEAAVDILGKLLLEKDKDGDPIHTKQKVATDGWYNTGKAALTDLNQKLNAHLQSKIGKRQEVIAKKKGLADTIEPIYNKGKIKIYHIPPLANHSPENMRNRHRLYCKYGKGTSWCTAQPSWEIYRNYILNDIYIMHENDVPIYQWVDGRNKKNTQFMDVHDREVKALEAEGWDAIKDAGLFPTIEKYKIKKLLSKEEFDSLSLQEKIDFIRSLWMKKTSIRRLLAIYNNSNELQPWFLEQIEKNQGYDKGTTNYTYLNTLLEAQNVGLIRSLVNYEEKKGVKIKDAIKAAITERINKMKLCNIEEIMFYYDLMQQLNFAKDKLVHVIEQEEEEYDDVDDPDLDDLPHYDAHEPDYINHLAKTVAQNQCDAGIKFLYEKVPDKGMWIHIFLDVAREVIHSRAVSPAIEPYFNDLLQSITPEEYEKYKSEIRRYFWDYASDDQSWEHNDIDTSLGSYMAKLKEPEKFFSLLQKRKQNHHPSSLTSELAYIVSQLTKSSPFHDKELLNAKFGSDEFWDLFGQKMKNNTDSFLKMAKEFIAKNTPADTPEKLDAIQNLLLTMYANINASRNREITGYDTYDAGRRTLETINPQYEVKFLSMASWAAIPQITHAMSYAYHKIKELLDETAEKYHTGELTVDGKKPNALF